jgi:hypothetical protein
MAREADKHEQKKRHADDLNTKKVAAAKAMAAAKPKKAKKAA